MFTADGRYGFRTAGQAANLSKDNGNHSTNEDTDGRQPASNRNGSKAPLGAASPAPAPPRLACGPANQAAVIPPMQRRLITLSTAGNLKISPLAPQQLQQRRPMAALRPPVQSTDGDPNAVVAAGASPPLFRLPSPEEPEAYGHGCGPQQDEGGDDGSGREDCGGRSGSGELPHWEKRDFDAQEAAAAAAIAAAAAPSAKQQQPPPSPPQPSPSPPPSPLRQLFPLQTIPCSEIRTPSRLLLRPMLQPAPETLPSLSPVSAGASASAVITAWPGLAAAADPKLRPDGMLPALDRNNPTAAARDNTGADGAPEEGYSFRFRPLAAAAIGPATAAAASSENTQYSPSPFAAAAGRCARLSAGADHLNAPLASPTDAEASVVGSPAGCGASTARFSSTNPPDDALLADNTAAAEDGPAPHANAPHHHHHHLNAAPEVSQQASACGGPSCRADVGTGAGALAAAAVAASAFPQVSQVTVCVTVAVRGKKAGRGPGAREDAAAMHGGYVRGPVCGDFDLVRYLDGRDCVMSGGRWVSKSQFEKIGGSAMAKWYRSIRVLPDLEPLGEWLERHGLPVTKGPARRSRKRPNIGDSDDEQQRQHLWNVWQAAQEAPAVAAGTGLRHHYAHVLPTATATAAPAPVTAAVTPIRRAPDCAMLSALLATAAAAAAAEAANEQPYGDAGEEKEEEEEEGAEGQGQGQGQRPCQRGRGVVAEEWGPMDGQLLMLLHQRGKTGSPRAADHCLVAQKLREYEACLRDSSAEPAARSDNPAKRRAVAGVVGSGDGGDVGKGGSSSMPVFRQEYRPGPGATAAVAVAGAGTQQAGVSVVMSLAGAGTGAPAAKATAGDSCGFAQARLTHEGSSHSQLPCQSSSARLTSAAAEPPARQAGDIDITPLKLPLKRPLSAALQPDEVVDLSAASRSFTPTTTAAQQSDHRHHRGPRAHELPAAPVVAGDGRTSTSQSPHACASSNPPLVSTENRLLALRLSPLRPGQASQPRPLSQVQPMAAAAAPLAPPQQPQDCSPQGLARPRLLLRGVGTPAGGGVQTESGVGAQPYVLSVQAPPTMLYLPQSGARGSEPPPGGRADGGMLEGAWARVC
uniref:RlsA n=1 Tax=Pandorina morum TaxID=33099 RepID=A0A1W5IS35_PANMO|nr:rlsA [Pandorina morum]